jgi:putative transcriptional regulator
VQTYKITEEIQLTTSLDILESITHHDDFQGMIALGYAGWGPGQLEKEISDNVWLSCPANSDILFDMPVDERMQAAAGLLGIKLNQLTAHSGHA